ncbi:hypothetical protein A4X09_0g5599 [Tilletia walkeri]|uniref:Cytochrome b561 domain-containing protein n=1 Tax=Tilletia walkeri TaxID=117179 RepID=A0A8X7T361_9BASI|nr:hypothetical protein A4X09_0g5599 [Tilletia walkeri]
MRFGPSILLSAVALAASTRAAKFGDQFCKSALCIGAIYDDEAMTVSYKAVYTGTAPGWIGVGQGPQMAGANMMVGWATSDGKVVLSQRSAPSHVMPTAQQVKASAFVPNADASSTNSSMTVLSWMFPVQAGFASSKTAHIWSISSVSPNSADANANLVKHNQDGHMSLDLTKLIQTKAPASGSGTGNSTTGTGSGTADDPMPTSGGSSSDGQEYEGGIRDLSLRPVRLYLAHMIVMCIAWFGLVPAGILIGRFGRTLFPDSWLKFHRGVQMTAVLAIIIGFGLAVSAVSSIGDPHFEGTHQRVGLAMFILVLIQASWGHIGHFLFKSRGSRLVNYGHILLGTVLFFGLALWQVRTGFGEWAWQAPSFVPNIVFPVLFGVITAAWLLGMLLIPRQNRRATESREKIPSSPYDSSNPYDPPMGQRA